MEFKTKYQGREVPFPSKQIKKSAAKLSPRKLERLSVLAEREMRKYLTAVADEMDRRHGGAWPGGTTNTTLSKRSGAMLKSIRNFMVRRNGMDTTGHIRLRRDRIIHETGGWIRATRSQYLTIPLSAALKPDGTPRKRSAREWQNTFVRRSRNGNLIIFQTRGTRIVPLYVLKKKVRIRARLGLRKALTRLRPLFRRAMLAHIRDLKG